MFRPLDLTTSVLASSLRAWRGTSGSKSTHLPKQPVQLFDCEGDPSCRLVREAITELNLDAMIYPCPEGGHRHLPRLQELSGGVDIPFLLDPNTQKKLSGANAIVTYLFRQYRLTDAPAALRDTGINHLSSVLASRIRFNAGSRAVPSRNPAQYLTLYSFESSPYSRIVREKLSELELPYLLINLGKQQKADAGPAYFRFTLKPYRPLPNTKRAQFFAEHGDVQVPYLKDPNTGREMFESADIARYLETTYRRGNSGPVTRKAFD